MHDERIKEQQRSIRACGTMCKYFYLGGYWHSNISKVDVTGVEATIVAPLGEISALQT